MAELEAQITKSWASLFIDTRDREEIVYSDFVDIYHSMYNTSAPDPVEDVSGYIAKKLKEKVNLTDFTLRNADYQFKILLYLSCTASCPRQQETIGHIQDLPMEMQRFIYEVIQDIEGLIDAHASKRVPSRSEEDVLFGEPGESWQDVPSGRPSIAQQLEESFSAAPDTDDESWREKYNSLRLQHISDEVEIQDLNEALQQCYAEVAAAKSENEHLQSQLSEKDSLKLQLDDYRQSSVDLSEQLIRAKENVSKLRVKLKDISELESTLSDRDGEVASLRQRVSQLEKLNEQNQQARVEHRREYQEKCRLQVEKATLESVISTLREEVEAAKQRDRRASLAPSSAAHEEEVEELRKENQDLRMKLENLEIAERVLQEQVDTQVAEITRHTSKLVEVELSMKRKSEQLTSWKGMMTKLKNDHETKLEDLQFEHRRELSRLKSELSEELFVSKKELLAQEAQIRKLERAVEAARNRSPAVRRNYASPAPCTPVLLRKYRPKTPSNIPRLIVTPKRTPAGGVHGGATASPNYAKEVDAARIDEISRRNQATLPHLRSTYPVEVQYHDKPVKLDSTGQVLSTPTTTSTTCSRTRCAAAAAATRKISPRPAGKATAFEIPNSPKFSRKKKAGEPEERMPNKKIADLRSSKEKLGFLPSPTDSDPEPSEKPEGEKENGCRENRGAKVLIQISPPRRRTRRGKRA